MNDNPYYLSDDGKTRVINFSGGRSSAYMLYHILDAHGGELPDSVVVVFANTGKERVETLDFIAECGKRWGVDVAWLEFRFDPSRKGGREEPKSYFAVVDRDTASTHGEPFVAMIERGSILPNAVMRKCTSDLKVLPIDRYVTKVLGWTLKDTRKVIGIRHDEPWRWKKALFEECRTEYPMVHAKASVEMVNTFWQEQDFDLGIPSYKGNCDGCFLKGANKLRHIFSEEPRVADWWIAMENKCTNGDTLGKPWDKPEMARFSKDWSYQQLLDEATRQQGFDFSPASDDGGGVDCFCGD